jgi:hypothetical protein
MTVSRSAADDFHPLDDLVNNDTEAAFFVDFEEPARKRRVLPMVFAGFGLVCTTLGVLFFGAMAFGDDVLGVNLSGGMDPTETAGLVTTP